MITFRRPRPDEAAAMAKLHVQCWREAYSAIVPEGVSSRFDVAPMIVRWQEHLSKDDRFIHAAFDGVEPVAFINQGSPVEKIHDEMDGHIAALYVAQSHYRKGLGRTLMALSASDWVGKGGHSITLGVLAANTRARAFYESMGGRLLKTGFYDWHGFQLEDAIYVFEDLHAVARRPEPKWLDTAVGQFQLRN
jgi:ribosomal protein S18 acetylase RimI-like enzyme